MGRDAWDSNPHREKSRLETKGEGVVCKPGKGSLMEPTLRTTQLGLPPELWENKIHHCCLSPLSLGFCCDGPSKPTHTLVLHSTLQPCPTRRNPVDCCPRGSSVHGILQARRLGWVAISSSRGSSQPRD